MSKVDKEIEKAWYKNHAKMYQAPDSWQTKAAYMFLNVVTVILITITISVLILSYCVDLVEAN